MDAKISGRIRAHSSTAAKRLLKDLREFKANNLGCVTAEPLDDNLYEWHINVRHRSGTYRDLVLHYIMTFTDAYPTEPPKVVSAVSIKHPCVDSSSGQVCLDVLSRWSSAFSASTVLMELQYLLLADKVESTFGLVTEIQPDRRLEQKISAGPKCACGHTNQSPHPPVQGRSRHGGTSQKGKQTPLHERQAQTYSLSPRKPRRRRKGRSSPVSTADSPKCYWNALSREIAKHVFDYLNFIDLKCIQRTCTEFARIIDTLHLEFQRSLICFHRKVTMMEDILGYGLQIQSRSGAKPASIVPRLDMLSFGAFKEDHVRLSASHKSLTHFLPLAITKQNSDRIWDKRVFQECIARIASVQPAAFDPAMALQVLCSSAHGVVSNLSAIVRPSQADVQQAVIGYMALHHLMLDVVVRHPEVQHAFVEPQTQAYKNGDMSRNTVPHLGELMALYGVAPQSPDWPLLLDQCVCEFLIRQVQNMLKSKPELGLLDNLQSPQPRECCWRLGQTFKHSVSDLKVLLLHLVFLREVVRRTQSVEVSLQRLHERFGRPAVGMEAHVHKRCAEIALVQDWSDFFMFLGKRPVLSSVLCKSLESAVTESERRHYHSAKQLRKVKRVEERKCSCPNECRYSLMDAAARSMKKSHTETTRAQETKIQETEESKAQEDREPTQAKNEPDHRQEQGDQQQSVHPEAPVAPVTPPRQVRRSSFPQYVANPSAPSFVPSPYAAYGGPSPFSPHQPHMFHQGYAPMPHVMSPTTPPAGAGASYQQQMHMMHVHQMQMAQHSPHMQMPMHMHMHPQPQTPQGSPAHPVYSLQQSPMQPFMHMPFHYGGPLPSPPPMVGYGMMEPVVDPFSLDGQYYGQPIMFADAQDASGSALQALQAREGRPDTRLKLVVDEKLHPKLVSLLTDEFNKFANSFKSKTLLQTIKMMGRNKRLPGESKDDKDNTHGPEFTRVMTLDDWTAYLQAVSNLSAEEVEINFQTSSFFRVHGKQIPRLALLTERERFAPDTKSVEDALALVRSSPPRKSFAMTRIYTLGSFLRFYLRAALKHPAVVCRDIRALGYHTGSLTRYRPPATWRQNASSPTSFTVSGEQQQQQQQQQLQEQSEQQDQRARFNVSLTAYGDAAAMSSSPDTTPEVSPALQPQSGRAPHAPAVEMPTVCLSSTATEPVFSHSMSNGVTPKSVASTPHDLNDEQVVVMTPSSSAKAQGTEPSALSLSAPSLSRGCSG